MPAHDTRDSVRHYRARNARRGWVSLAADDPRSSCRRMRVARTSGQSVQARVAFSTVALAMACAVGGVACGAASMVNSSAARPSIFALPIAPNCPPVAQVADATSPIRQWESRPRFPSTVAPRGAPSATMPSGSRLTVAERCFELIRRPIRPSPVSAFRISWDRRASPCLRSPLARTVFGFR